MSGVMGTSALWLKGQGLWLSHIIKPKYLPVLRNQAAGAHMLDKEAVSFTTLYGLWAAIDLYTGALQRTRTQFIDC